MKQGLELLGTSIDGTPQMNLKDSLAVFFFFQLAMFDDTGRQFEDWRVPKIMLRYSPSRWLLGIFDFWTHLFSFGN